MLGLLRLFTFLNISLYSISCETIRVHVDSKQNSEPFTHFWKSTGLCPSDPKEQIPEFFMREDQKVNLALIGCLPNRGIEQVRIHWLYNLIILKKDEEIISFDYRYLDYLLDYLATYNLRPGFELMGYATSIKSNEMAKAIFSNFTLADWKSFTRKLVRHYIDKYGIHEVVKWRFETWNEPDLKNYNVLNFTTRDYLQYVFGSWRGLKEAFQRNDSSNTTEDPMLIGPAGLFRDRGHHPFCWGLLQYCNELIASCPVQYISFHRKGDGTAEGVLNVTLELLDSLYKRLPNIKILPIVNDEADIMRTWSKSMEWRGDTRYAAMIVKVIADYYRQLQLNRKLKIQLLSNDNGFLNYHPYYFTQRTLFARFQMNNSNPPHIQFIKKPSYMVMGLLSQLGDEYMQANISPKDPRLTVLATRTTTKHHLSTALLLAYANSSSIDTDTFKTIEVAIFNLDEFDARVVVYLMDNIYTNPYRVWRDGGSPVFPSKELRTYMRAVEEPMKLAGPYTISEPNITIRVNLTIPSVALIKICNRPTELPDTIENLKVINITYNEVLLTWSNIHINNKCILTYEVELKSRCENSSEFKRVNTNETVFLSYHHAPPTWTGDTTCEATTGRYRVRAMDLWGRPGNYSASVPFPSTDKDNF